MFEHDFPFDPTYGYTRETLLQVPGEPGPDDFDAFWQATYAAARAVPLNITTRPCDLSTGAIEVLEYECDSLGIESDEPVRVGGWIVRPRNQTPVRGVVVGHGYGGRDLPDLTQPRLPSVNIFPCARGFDRSASPHLPSTSAFHVIHGLKSRETYIHRGCAADYWAAASVLLELHPDLTGRLQYHGGSFGGGIGALMLPWDDRFRCAYLGVPSFGPHPLRLTLQCNGSGEAVRTYYRHHPEAIDVLQYFDSTTAAMRLKIPTMFCCALFDPAVPPPGQFAVHNSCAAEKDLVIRSAGHFDYVASAAEDRAGAEVLADWFERDLAR